MSYLPVCPAKNLATLWRYKKHSVEAVHGWLRRQRADGQDRVDGAARRRSATGACWIETFGANARCRPEDCLLRFVAGAWSGRRVRGDGRACLQAGRCRNGVKEREVRRALWF